MSVDLAARLLEAIRAAGRRGLTGTQQRDALNHRGNAGALREELEAAGLVTTKIVSSGGRPKAVTVAVTHPGPRRSPAISDQSSAPVVVSGPVRSQCVAWDCDKPGMTTPTDDRALCGPHRRWLHAGHTLDGPAPW